MSECDMSEIPSAVIRSALHESVVKKLKSKKYKIDISSASHAGANNFMGSIYRVSFSKEDDNEEEQNPIHKMIVKVSPQQLARREQFFSRASFLREIYMYEKVLPYFREFEQSKGVIIEENGFIEYPLCYGSIDVDINECIFLEDLSVREFSMIDKCTEVVTAEHVRLMMKILAKFHAISFVTKDQQPERFKKLASNLTENFIRRDNPMLREYFKMNFQAIFDALPNDEDALVRSQLQKLLETEPIDIAADCIDPESAEPAAIITHGDTWQNNTMFKYDKNGKPNEIMLLDWQISRYCSPIVDIVYFIFACTTKELRDAHYDEFLKIYHESLTSHIQKLGSDPEKLFPYEMMLEHFRRFAKFGLIMAAMLLQIITADSGHAVDLDEFAEQINNNFKDGTAAIPDISMEENPFICSNSQHKFKKRLRDVAIDMVRLGYI